mmetsp:Transcript_4265/g.11322  ORF Transcript_4265/g.11322 Transcript_4265/m.11322 type:complete len:325 (-) Transcript_4265:1347-2321(-)
MPACVCVCAPFAAAPPHEYPSARICADGQPAPSLQPPRPHPLNTKGHVASSVPLSASPRHARCALATRARGGPAGARLTPWRARAQAALRGARARRLHHTLDVGDGRGSAAEELELGLAREGEVRRAILLAEVARDEGEGRRLERPQRGDVLGAVARAGERHLDKGGHARGHLDHCGESREEADEEGVGLERGHVDPAGARAVSLLHHESAGALHLGREGVARVNGELGHREGQVLVLDAHFDPLGLAVRQYLAQVVDEAWAGLLDLLAHELTARGDGCLGAPSSVEALQDVEEVDLLAVDGVAVVAGHLEETEDERRLVLPPH